MPWAPIAASPYAAVFPKVVRDHLNRIYMTGGDTGGGTVLGSVARYDPGTGAWTSLSSMSDVRKEHALVCDSNNNIYAIGGDTGIGATALVEKFDPGLGTWANITNMPGARRLHGAVIDDDDNIYVVGGYSDTGGPTAYQNTIYMWDGASWTTLSTMADRRRDHGTGMANGKIFVAGGLNDSGVVSSVEQYVIATNTWSSVGTMSVPRLTFGCVTGTDGMIYLIGGLEGDGSTSDALERIDSATGTVSTLVSLTGARYNGDYAIDSYDRPVAVGGINAALGVPYLDTVERFDPDAGTWSSLSNLQYARFWHASIYDEDDVLYAISGGRIDLSDFDPVDVPSTVTESIDLGPSFSGGGGGGGGGEPFVPSSGDTLAGVGFIPLTNVSSSFPGDDVFPGPGAFPGP